MKQNLLRQWKSILVALLLPSLGCHKTVGPAAQEVGSSPGAALDPLRVALSPHSGDTALDKEIVRAQQSVTNRADRAAAVERLGWLFVAKARASFDAGYFKLAEQCALALENGAQTNSATGADAVAARRYAALLLRGHVLHNLHQFKAAEPLARELAEQRGSPMDFGLLGDVLMELGRLEAAAAAYQKMLDLRPDSRALARAAHMRWLKGDAESAIEAMREAVGGMDARDVDAAAWMQTRLAFYELASAQNERARRDCAAALELNPDYAPALLLAGRMALAEGKATNAVAQFQRAVKLNPLPEYYWALAEALAEAGRQPEAETALADLAKRGADDARTYAIYLATTQQQPELAVRLATRELGERADVFTYDCLAWTQLAAGNLSAAQQAMEQALAEGTPDARLFFHAAVIASRAGQTGAAEKFSQKSRALAHLLLPSERKQLYAATGQLNPSVSVTATGGQPKPFSAGAATK